VDLAKKYDCNPNSQCIVAIAHVLWLLSKNIFGKRSTNAINGYGLTSCFNHNLLVSNQLPSLPFSPLVKAIESYLALMPRFQGVFTKLVSDLRQAMEQTFDL